jgi:tetratricopeptide (TPR) repeat protein
MAFFVLGALLAFGGGERRARRPLLAVAPVAVALAALYSLTAPWLSGRYVDSAYDRSSIADARTARDLDPFAVDPLFAMAELAALRRDFAGATRHYEEATRVQPKNSSTWYALGAWELALDHYRRALLFLDRAYGLDPWGPAGYKGGLLDQARAKVQELDAR